MKTVNRDMCINFVLPNDYLARRDRKYFQHVWNTVQDDNVSYSTIIKYGTQNKPMLNIIDEVDLFLYGSPINFFDDLGKLTHAIMFTGTLGNFASPRLKDMLTQYKVKLVTFAPTEKFQEQPTCSEKIERQDLAAYVATEQKSHSVVIVTTEESLAKANLVYTNAFRIDISKAQPVVPVNDRGVP